MRDIQEIGFRGKLPEGSCWIYNCHTIETHRGRSIYPTVLRRIISDFCSSGGKTTWIDVSNDNSSSIRGIIKAGFLEVARAERTVLFSTWTCMRKITIANHTLGDCLLHLDPRWTTFS
jgi:hypothetical protein